MKLGIGLTAAALIFLVAAASAAPGGGHGVPGPIAGAGLPFLVAFGAYKLIRKRRAKTPPT